MENKRKQDARLIEALYDLFIGQLNIENLPIDVGLEKEAEEYEGMYESLIDNMNILLDKLPDELKNKFGENEELENMLDICQDISRYAFRSAYRYGYLDGQGHPHPQPVDLVLEKYQT